MRYSIDLQDSLARIAISLEKIAGCTGYLDDEGNRIHDGDTCPVHEGEDLSNA